MAELTLKIEREDRYFDKLSTGDRYFASSVQETEMALFAVLNQFCSSFCLPLAKKRISKLNNLSRENLRYSGRYPGHTGFEDFTLAVDGCPSSVGDPKSAVSKRSSLCNQRILQGHCRYTSASPARFPGPLRSGGV